MTRFRRLSDLNDPPPQLVVPWVSAPASATASGAAGQIAYDGSYFYVCTATNTWGRTALASWVSFTPIPVMTSATSPAGVVSDSGVLEEATPSWRAFDKSTVSGDTVFYASPIPAAGNWIQYDFGFQSAANGYQITSRQSAPFGSTQAPPSWTVSGSNDGSSFTTIDTRSGQTWNSSGEQKSFTFSATAVYRYWRWTWGAHDTTIVIPKIQLTALASGADADATAFLSAAGISNATQSNAIYSLVDSLKSASVWSKMLAIYPLVGGSSSTHQWNLKDPRDLDAAYRLTFGGGWSHAATGMTPSSGYADTKLNPSSAFGDGTYSLGIFLRTDPSSDNSYRVDIGCADQVSPSDSRFYGHIVSGDGSGYFDYRSRLVVSNSSYGSATAFHVLSRSSSSSLKVYRNGVSKGENTSGSGTYPIPSRSVWLGANNNTDTVSGVNYSNREISFAFIGQSLTEAEVASVNTAVQAYQSALSRNV